MLFYSFNGGTCGEPVALWHQPADVLSLEATIRSSRPDTLEERFDRPRQVRRPTWAPELAERVLSLRKHTHVGAKDKLVVLLRREKITALTSMVGAYWWI